MSLNLRLQFYMQKITSRKTPKRTDRPLLQKTNILKRKPPVINRRSSKQPGQRAPYSTHSSFNRCILPDRDFQLHFASATEVIYSPFQKEYYLPPHLSSADIQNTIFRGESPRWHVRPCSAKKYNYDQLYKKSEKRYQNLSGSLKKWKHTKSKIKSILDQDRATHQMFQRPPKMNCCQRESHPDDDLSEQSSLQASNLRTT